MGTNKLELADQEVGFETESDVSDDVLGNGKSKIILAVENLTFEVGKKSKKKDILHSKCPLCLRTTPTEW